MEADSDPVSDNRTDNQETGSAPVTEKTGSMPDTEEADSPADNEENGSAPFDRMVWPRPAPDIDPGHLPEIPSHQQVWWYDQPAKGKRGKHRRYLGHVKRIGGAEGERIRRELAATIYDLLLWANNNSKPIQLRRILVRTVEPMSTPTDPLAVPPPAPALTHRGGTPGRVPVSGPSGLSDYAVSPLGVPIALLQDEVRVAFLGRTSTEDQQDPRQSLIRQLGNSKTAIPESWVIVAKFYDVESGRMELSERGQKTDYERFDIPIARDGGIADLLAEAAHKNRRFDVVICESLSRVARRAFEGLSVERELERADVPLFAANEPITLTGSRAQRILQRRINQSVAEYEVLNILEQSWGGLCTHVKRASTSANRSMGTRPRPSGTPTRPRPRAGTPRPGSNRTASGRRRSPRSPCGPTTTAWALTPSPTGSTRTS